MHDGVDTYAVGLVNASCCAPASMERAEVERQVNRQHPTGICSQWTISDDKTFATGGPHPGICERDANRRHYLLHC